MVEKKIWFTSDTHFCHKNILHLTETPFHSVQERDEAIIKRWNEVVDKPFYLHSIRHYYTTNLLAIGLEQELVQEIVGWTSADMVKIYNDATAKDREWKGLAKLKQSLEQDIKVGDNNV